jgi:hypothetical protein
VDKFARLKADIKRLQNRAEPLRESFLRSGARLRSNRFEITVKRQKRSVFVKDRLTEAVLADPIHWKERESEVVTCNEITTFRAGGPDIVLIE